MRIARKILLACLFVAGCAPVRGPDYYKPRPLAALQDPLPGQGLLYLFRAPYDLDSFIIELTTRSPFLLRASTYVVLSLPPGDYQMSGKVSSVLGYDKSAFAPANIHLTSNERAFLYVSGNTSQSFALPAALPIGKGVIVLGMASLGQSTDPNTRRWTECNEIDAQGFMSISTRANAE
jgi:hypothetical protein